MNDQEAEIKRYHDVLQDLVVTILDEVSEPSPQLAFVLKQARRVLAHETGES